MTTDEINAQVRAQIARRQEDRRLEAELIRYRAEVNAATDRMIAAVNQHQADTRRREADNRAALAEYRQRVSETMDLTPARPHRKKDRISLRAFLTGLFGMMMIGWMFVQTIV